MSTQLFFQSDLDNRTGLPARPFTRASRLGDRDGIARRRLQQIAGFLAEAERAIESDEFEAGVAACEEVLVRDPDHDAALACLDRINAILDERRAAAARESRRLRLDAVGAAVQEDIEALQFTRALARVAAAEREDGPFDDRQDLHALAARAREGRVELEHREAIAAAVNDQIVRAARLLAADDHHGALACIEAALTLDPSHPAATALHVQMRDSASEPPAVAESEPQVITIEGDEGDPLALFASEAEPPAPAPAAPVPSVPVPQVVQASREGRPDVQPRAARPVAPLAVVVRARRSFRPSIAAVALLVVLPGAGGLWSAWQFVSPAALPVVPAATLAQPAPAFRAAAAPADTESAIVTAKTPVAARPPIATGVNELADQAQHHLAQGDRDEALSLLARAASIAPRDPQLGRVVDDALTSARAAAAQARAAASASGAAGGAGYRDTDSRGLEAARLERAGSRVGALALWWQAADGYAVALRDTRAPVPVPEPAAAAEAVPAPAGPSADERMVRTALQAYVAAYSALDVDGVRAVFPGASEPALRRTFNALRSQQVEMRNEQMAVAGDAATVSCTLVTSSIGIESGAVAARDSRRAVFNLAKRDGTWVVVDRRQ